MAKPISFNRTLDFEYGRVDVLSPLVRRVICNNPSVFTFKGTGTYIVGHRQVAVIDPGPADKAHIESILAATRGETITHVLITHTHLDHSAGCTLLQQYCDAPSFGFGPHGYGGSADDAPARDGVPEFGADHEFDPDVRVQDGQRIALAEPDRWSLECVYTPGHAQNHMSYRLTAENALFCGDAVMGWSTTIVSPPDGNMTAYMATLERLLGGSDRIYYPTHGAPIENPLPYVSALKAHRQQREQEVLRCLQDGPRSIDEMVPLIYKELNPAMYPAAARSLEATAEHLVRLRLADVQPDADIVRYRCL